MRSVVWRCLLCLLMASTMIVGCTKPEDEPLAGLRLVATLKEKCSPPAGANWRDFAGVHKFEVIDPLQSGIDKGIQLNVVMPRKDVTRPGFTTMRTSIKTFEVGKPYVLVITADLPPGWEPIERDFSDERLGFYACMSAEPRGY